MIKLSILIFILISVGILFGACRKPSPKFQAGGIYSIDNGDGSYGVVKLLVYENDIFHVAIYKQKFQTRPEKIDISRLSFGTPNDPDGFGIGHLPLSKVSFLEWRPEFITLSGVTADELEGYKMWKEDKGGVF